MQGAGRTMLLAVALISAASLGYELLLLRFFSIMYWDHAAHLIISMALLGFGGSGTLLALTQDRLLARMHRSFFRSALLFACSLPVAATLAGWVDFNPPEVIWRSSQLARLAALFMVATVPFLCAGLCIGLTMRWRPPAAARIYRADLCGAAVGALAIMALLFILPPQDALRVLALLGLTAALLIGGSFSGWERWPGLTAGTLLIILWPVQWLVPAISSYKGLSQALNIPGVGVAVERHTPTGSFAAVTSADVPFRFAPGLSLLAPVAVPEQVALFHDGHPAGVILGTKQGLPSLDFLRWTPMGAAYTLVHQPRVLVVGAGGGADVWHALLEDAKAVEAIEPHAELVDLVTGGFAAFSGDIYHQAGVRLHRGDVRGVLAAAGGRYDLIQISPLGTAAPPSATDGQALTARWLFTVEGVHLMLSRLTEKGVLSVTLPMELPPRSSVKMAATVAEALKGLDPHSEPAARVAVIRTWNTVTILASRAVLSDRQMVAIRDFCRTRAFDLDWLPDIDPQEINRINVLERPYLHEAIEEIWQGLPHGHLGLFHLDPATDDRPWFGHFFRWTSFSALWEQRAAGAASLLQWEYLLLWLSLAIALIVSLAAIVWPLFFLPNLRRTDRGRQGWLIRGGYFAALGVAFLFVEIAFMQQFIVFLSHPMIAMAVIVPSFLFWAGLGSGMTGHLADLLASRPASWLRDRPVGVAVAAIVLVSALYQWLLPLVFQAGAGWPPVARAGVSFILIGGLAVWMGMPFPLGLTRLGVGCPSFIPLAWGMNGFFSVLSAIAAAILALHGGFRLVVGVAIGLYIVAASLERRL